MQTTNDSSIKKFFGGKYEIGSKMLKDPYVTNKRKIHIVIHAYAGACV